MEYVIAKDCGQNEPITYFCCDSFWPDKLMATRFADKMTAEKHARLLATLDKEDPSLYHVMPAA